MKASRYAALAALIALAGACQSPVPTAPGMDAPAGPVLDGGNGMGSGNFLPGGIDPDDGDGTQTTGTAPAVTGDDPGGEDEERGGNGMGSGN